MTSIESLAWWKIHMAAQRKAEAAGACWRCAAEMGAAVARTSMVAEVETNPCEHSRVHTI